MSTRDQFVFIFFFKRKKKDEKSVALEVGRYHPITARCNKILGNGGLSSPKNCPVQNYKKERGDGIAYPSPLRGLFLVRKGSPSTLDRDLKMDLITRPYLSPLCYHNLTYVLNIG